MATKISAFPQDLPILNQALRDLQALQTQVANLQAQINAILVRLKAASIP